MMESGENEFSQFQDLEMEISELGRHEIKSPKAQSWLGFQLFQLKKSDIIKALQDTPNLFIDSDLEAMRGYVAEKDVNDSVEVDF